VSVLCVDVRRVITSGMLLGEAPYKCLNLLREALGTYAIVYEVADGTSISCSAMLTFALM
jgi:hypothetical protein